MKKKYLLLLISIFFLTNFNSKAQDFWEVVPTPASSTHRSIAIHNNGDIFLGSNGIYMSQDNGNSWDFMGLVGRIVYAIEIDSSGNIFAATNYKIYKSSDHGASWQVVHSILANVLTICSGENGLMFAGTGDNIGILRSYDYGENWDTCFLVSGAIEYIMDVAIARDGTVYAGTTAWMGSAGGVYRSNDNGENWEHIGLFNHYVHAVGIDSDLNVFAGSVGQHNTFEIGFYKLDTNNGSWIHQKNNVTVLDITFDANNDIYIGCTIEGGGHPAGVFRSFDGGFSWEQINSGLVSNSVHGVAINPDNYIFAIASYPSTLTRSVEPIIVSIDNSEYKVSDIRVYPNPCLENINVSFPFVLFDSQLIVNLYSSSGVLEFHKTYNYNPDSDLFLELSKENLASGIYLLQIIVGDHSKTAKIIKR